MLTQTPVEKRPFGMCGALLQVVWFFGCPVSAQKLNRQFQKKKILSSSNEIHSKASAFLSEKKYIDFLYVLNVLFCVMETRRVAPPFSLDKI
jgi:hypothetical protein